MAKYLIDTCIFRDWAIRKDPAYSKLMANRHHGIVLPIVTVGEVIWGWHRKAIEQQTPQRELQLYLSMMKAVEIFQKATIVPFDDAAQQKLQRIRPGRGNRGTCDLRIASIALQHDLVLVTNNIDDFRGIPGLVIEDWTKQSTH